MFLVVNVLVMFQIFKTPFLYNLSSFYDLFTDCSATVIRIVIELDLFKILKNRLSLCIEIYNIVKHKISNI